MVVLCVSGYLISSFPSPVSHWVHWQCDNFLSSPSIHGCLPGPAKGQACPLLEIILPPLLLSAPPSSSWHNALQDGFGKASWVAYVTIPFQLLLLNHCQKVFEGANGCFSSTAHFFIGNLSLYEIAGSCGRILSPWPGSVFVSLLLRVMSHRHMGKLMLQVSASVGLWI